MRTQPIPTLATAGLLATLALPCAALAGSPLAANAIPVDPNQSVSGHFDAAGTQTWRLYLRQGKHYALRGGTGAFQVVTVQEAGGKAVARFAMAYGDDLGDGADFDAPYTGLYAVVVRQPASCFGQTPCLGGQGGLAGRYLLSVGRDCPGDPSTSCAIAVGQTLRGLWASHGGDSDDFRATLAAGVRYAIAVPTQPGQGDYLVWVRDARARRRAWQIVDGGGPPMIFTAPYSGTFYLDVTPDDGAIGPYDLSLSTAR